MPQHFKTTDYKIDDIHYFIVPRPIITHLITSKKLDVINKKPP